MTWQDEQMAAFDVETTGVDVETARIVTATVALVGGGKPTEARSWLADPGIEIPEGATAVHGVTTERAQAEGRPAAEVVAEVVQALMARPQGAPVVAFNARYDLTVLDREARRHGVTPLPRVGLYVLDPLVIDKWLHRYRRGSRKLDAMCEHYGARLDGAHDAAFDALAAARVAWVIGKRGRVMLQRPPEAVEAQEAEWERVRDDLPLLHAAQVGWAAEQQASLRDYFRGRGQTEDADGVVEEWPLVTFAGAAA